MESFLQDFRYALRMLVKAPGFAAVAILTLALGIGANTALFSVVNGVLLNPLSYPQPDALVSVYSNTAKFDRSSISYLNFLDWQKDSNSFEAIAAYRNDSFNLTGWGEPERLRGYMISAGFFNILGVKPIFGRTFRPNDDIVGAGPVVLISAGFWKRKFGSTPDVLGKTITLNGSAHTIIGIIPDSFHFFGRDREVYVPIGQWNDSTFRDRRVSMGERAIGRLKHGMNLAQAQADMDGIARNLAAAYPDADKGSGIALVPLKADMIGDIKPFLLVLLGAVGFVLLIACANVANLLLARSTGRTREFAIRSALGASQTRVIRQLLTESVLLAIAGAALGLLIAYWGTRGVLGALPGVLPRTNEIGLDTHVLLFTFAVSVLVGIIFGLAPALKTSRANLQETLKEGGRGASGTRHRAQSVFVVVEMAMALVLLIGAGLMIRSLAELWSVNPGFNPHNVLTFDLALPPALAASPAAGVRAALRQVSATIGSVPGVQDVSILGGSLPMNGDSEVPFWRADQPKPASDLDMNWALFYLVEPDYLKAMGIKLERGRFITAEDNENSPSVMVIDQTFARKIFPNEDPIGKRVNLAILGVQPEIVGVVDHVKHWGLDSDATQTIQDQLYFPFMQIPDKFMPLVSQGVSMVLRTQGAPATVIAPIRQVVEKMSSDQVMYGVESMDEIIADSLAARRFSMILLGIFAGLALVLSAVGIYGVISYLVGQRTHEIGIRMALGAQRRDVLRLILGQGAKLALGGVAIGIVAALGLTRLMSKMIFGVSAHDPLTFGGVAFVLVLVALAACYVPARRAMRVDPMVALRYE